MSTPFPLLPLLRLLHRRCRRAFLPLLQAAQRVRIALFPLPLPPPPLSVLLADALLLLQAADALLLGRADQLSQLDGPDVVERRLAGLVQHDGVEDDVEQGNARDLLQAFSYCAVLENTDTVDLCNGKPNVFMSVTSHKFVTLPAFMLTVCSQIVSFE